MLAQARGCFVRAELLEGWPDRPLVRQRLPARRKVKPTRTSPREKYGLQRLSEMGPRLKPQPAPPIVRPAPLDVQQWYAQLADHGATGAAPERRRLFEDSPRLTPAMRARICARICSFTSWSPRLERAWLPAHLLLFDSRCTALFLHHMAKLQPLQPQQQPEQQQRGSLAQAERAAQAMHGSATARTSGRGRGSLHSVQRLQRQQRPLQGAAVARSAARSQDRAAFEGMMRGVCGALAAKLPGFSPEALSAIPLALGRMAILHAPLMRAWDQHSAARLHEFSAQQLCEAAAGVALLRHRPPQPWLDAFLAAVAGKMPFMRLQQLATILHALGQAQLQPLQQWVQRACDAVVAAAAAAEPRPADVAALMHGLGLLRATPSDAWSDWAVQLSGSMLGAAAFKPRDMAQLLQGTQLLRLQPGGDWMQSACAAAVRRHKAFSPQDWHAVLQALLALGVQPTDALVAAVLDYSQVKMMVLTPEQLVTTLQALAAWGVQPREAWTAGFALVTRGRLPSLALKDLAALTRWMLALRLDMPLLWVMALVARLGSQEAAPAALQGSSPDAEATAAAYGDYISILGAVRQLCPYNMQYIGSSCSDALRGIEAYCSAGRQSGCLGDAQLGELQQFFQQTGHNSKAHGLGVDAADGAVRK